MLQRVLIIGTKCGAGNDVPLRTFWHTSFPAASLMPFDGAKIEMLCGLPLGLTLLCTRTSQVGRYEVAWLLYLVQRASGCCRLGVDCLRAPFLLPPCGQLAANQTLRRACALWLQLREVLYRYVHRARAALKDRG